VGRQGGWRHVAAVTAGIVAFAGVAGCGNPTQAIRHCIGASDQTVLAIQQKLTGAQKLRNAKMVHLEGSDYVFVSAELHPFSDQPHDKGDIATWATTDVKTPEDFLSVDVHAREESTWPRASFDVTRDGVIESRACTGLNTGKTRAQINCEQQESAGDSVQLPKGKDCSDL